MSFFDLNEIKQKALRKKATEDKEKQFNENDWQAAVVKLSPVVKEFLRYMSELRVELKQISFFNLPGVRISGYMISYEVARWTDNYTQYVFITTDGQVLKANLRDLEGPCGWYDGRRCRLSDCDNVITAMKNALEEQYKKTL